MQIEFHIQDQTGHSTEAFDTATPEQLAAAAARFNELVGERMTPAGRGADGNPVVKPSAQRVFDPTQAETLFIPQLVGG